MLASHGDTIATAYEAHHATLVRRLTIMTRDAAEAEDIASEAFLRLAAVVEDGHAPDNTGAWLHRVAQNLVIGRHRHHQVAERHEARLERPTPDVPPDQAAIAREAREAVQAALERLTPVERQAVLMAADGYDGGEVASAIGRTASATRTLLCRARGKLRGWLTVELLNPA